MELSWYGRTCIRLRGRDAVVVNDPYQSVVGPTGRGITGEIVTYSHPDDRPLPKAKGKRSRDGQTLLPSSPRRRVRPRRARRVRGQGRPADGRPDVSRRREGRRPRQADRVHRRAGRDAHDPSRRDRPPADRGEARRHRAGRHRLRPDRRPALDDEDRGARRPARPADRRRDAARRGRAGDGRGTREVLPRDGRRADAPAEALGLDLEPAGRDDGRAARVARQEASPRRDAAAPGRRGRA